MAILNLSFVQAVNAPGEIVLTKSDVWAGLVALARQPESFTEYIQGCKLHGDGDKFKRTLVFKDPAMMPPDGRLEQELILTHEFKHECITLSTGNKVINVIHEEIGNKENQLSLSIEYNIPVGDVKAGSEEEAGLIAKYSAKAKENLSSGVETMRTMVKAKQTS